MSVADGKKKKTQHMFLMLSKHPWLLCVFQGHCAFLLLLCVLETQQQNKFHLTIIGSCSNVSVHNLPNCSVPPSSTGAVMTVMLGMQVLALGVHNPFLQYGHN